MVSFFKDKSAVSVFWLIILCFGLHVYSLVHPPQITASPYEGFFFYFIQLFANIQSYALSVLYVFIIFLEALQLNFIINDLRLLARPSYTTAAAFILLTALLPAFNQICPALIACNFLMWIIYSACRLYNAPNPKTVIYNLGLFTGALVILYFPSLPLVLIIILALAIMRPFRLNEWFVMIFGILTPVYFLISYLFLTDQLNLIPSSTQLFGLTSISNSQLPLLIITFSSIVIITFFGILSVQQTSGRVLIQVRKSWQLILITLIFLLPAVFLINHVWPTAVLLALIPASCYIGFEFSNINRSFLSALFFWMLFALSIYNNWFANY